MALAIWFVEKNPPELEWLIISFKMLHCCSPEINFPAIALPGLGKADGRDAFISPLDFSVLILIVLLNVTLLIMILNHVL